VAEAATTITLTAALLAGLAGSAHCFAMCGGLAGALGMRARTSGSHSAAVQNALLYQVGRIGGYMIAGALCGAFGAGLRAALDLARVGVALRVLSGVLILAVAARILFGWNLLSGVESLGARFWNRLRPLAQRSAHGGGHLSTLALGLLWGWLPCGLVYSMLLFATFSADAWHGAAIMMAFGLGTLPSMLGSSLVASQLQRWIAQPHMRMASGLALLVFGTWMILVAVQPHHGGSEHSGHDHHAMSGH
jgi:sulfite exporter TauE/SafE